MNDDVRQAHDDLTMIGVLESSPAFDWFCERMHAEGRKALRVLDPGVYDDRSYVDKVTEAQTLNTLNERLQRLRKRAQQTIDDNQPDPDQETDTDDA